MNEGAWLKNAFDSSRLYKYEEVFSNVLMAAMYYTAGEREKAKLRIERVNTVYPDWMNEGKINLRGGVLDYDLLRDATERMRTGEANGELVVGLIGAHMEWIEKSRRLTNSHPVPVHGESSDIV